MLTLFLTKYANINIIYHCYHIIIKKLYKHYVYDHKKNYINTLHKKSHIPEKLFLMMGAASRNAFLLVSIFLSKSFNTKHLKKN